MKKRFTLALRNLAETLKVGTQPKHAPSTKPEDHFFPKTYLTQDYFEAHAEPHRYYPTSMEWPCYVIHMGRRLIPRENALNRASLKDFLTTAVEGRWSRRVPNSPTNKDSSVFCLREIDRDFIGRFSSHYATDAQDPKEVEEAMGEVLAIDCCPVAHGQAPDMMELVNARIELHREYVTLTLFIPVKIAMHQVMDNSPPRRLSAEIVDITDAGATLRCEKSVSGTESLMKLLYDELPRAVLDASGSEEPSSIQAKLRRLVDEFTAGWGGNTKKSGSVPNESGIFCVFHGAVLASNCFDVKGLKPDFAEPHVISKWRPEQVEIENTISFLNRFWFLAKSSVYKTGLHDLVANFMRNGSVIYTSNVGAQTAPDAKDYLRFLLIYRAAPRLAPPGTRLQSPTDADEPATAPGARDRYLNQALKNDESFWVSRIVSRLLTMGTLRLMAIADLKLINSAMVNLQQIERAVTDIERDGPVREREQYVKLRKLIRERLSTIWTGNHSLISRLSSNKVAFQAMKRQLDDLEITRIPGWQSYDAFINRRLVTTYERISEIADQYEDIWRVIRSRMDVIEAGTTLRLTQLARHVGFAALAATLTKPAESFVQNQSANLNAMIEACGLKSPAPIAKAFVNFFTPEIAIFFAILGIIYGAVAAPGAAVSMFHWTFAKRFRLLFVLTSSLLVAFLILNCLTCDYAPVEEKASGVAGSAD